MMKMTIAAVALCACSAFGCPESEKAAEVAVQQVAQTTEKGDCSMPCEGEKGAAVQAVSNDAESCASECPMMGEAAVKTVANESGDCSAPCAEDKGAAVSTVAFEGDGKECSTIKASECESKKSCLTGAMPAMVYKVGNETTSCSKTADGMACEKSPVQYVVNNVAYECEMEAREAHMAAMETFIASMTHVSYNVGGEHMECPVGADKACEKSGEKVAYQVGPMVFDNAADAVRAAAMARGMMSQVAMTYEVDGEATSCEKSACDMASACETKKVEYVINGTKTSCDKEAAYLMTQAKAEAGIKALSSTI